MIDTEKWKAKAHDLLDLIEQKMEESIYRGAAVREVAAALAEAYAAGAKAERERINAYFLSTSRASP